MPSYAAVQATSQTNTSSASDWKETLVLIQDELKQAKESLVAIIPPQTNLLADTVSGSLSSGGKYLRPAITLLMGKALASQTLDTSIDPRHLIEVAAVSEMIHIATLLHDDVLDEADLRRAKPTVRAQLGNKVSVLSGDYLLAQASLKLSKLGNTRLVSIYAQVLADLCDGEVAQMVASYDLSSPMDKLWERYRHKTFCKTASLFAAGCEAAGVVYRLSESDIQTLRGFGTSFGMAFQVVDDLLDYTSSAEDMGKPVLDDLRHGLLNAPILLTLASDRLSDAEKATLRSDIATLLDNPPEAITDADLQPILAWIDKADAIQETYRLIERYTQEAVTALAVLENSEAKQTLVRLVQSVSVRKA